MEFRLFISILPASKLYVFLFMSASMKDSCLQRTILSVLLWVFIGTCVYFSSVQKLHVIISLFNEVYDLVLCVSIFLLQHSSELLSKF